MTQPKCFDLTSLNYLTLLGRRYQERERYSLDSRSSLIFRKRRADKASDDFFSESDDDDDWFDSDLSDDNETVSDECQNFTMPTLTSDQVANLLPLMQKYKKDGFSSDVGRLSLLKYSVVNHQIEVIFFIFQ